MCIRPTGCLYRCINNGVFFLYTTHRSISTVSFSRLKKTKTFCFHFWNYIFFSSLFKFSFYKFPRCVCYIGFVDEMPKSQTNNIRLYIDYKWTTRSGLSEPKPGVRYPFRAPARTRARAADDDDEQPQCRPRYTDRSNTPAWNVHRGECLGATPRSKSSAYNVMNRTDPPAGRHCCYCAIA